MVAHLGDCPACAAEAEQLHGIWRELGKIPLEPPDSAALRARFDAMLSRYRREHSEAQYAGERIVPFIRPRRWRFVYPFVGVAATLVLGIYIGRQSATVSTPESQLAAMHEELRATRQMVALSLLQQASASERLKGVSWSSKLDRPGGEVVTALLYTLRHDPNVNVRLASIDALQRFAENEQVRRATVGELTLQPSPLVQVALVDFLVQAGEREALQTLRDLARDPVANPAVRSRAAWGIDHLEQI
jgi:hypothetical protein